MLCELCKKKPAQTVFYKNIKGKRHELYVCRQCEKHERPFMRRHINVAMHIAPKKPSTPMPPTAVSKLDKLLSSIKKRMEDMPEFGLTDQTGDEDDSNVIVCSHCGHSLADLQNLHRLGCPHCYETLSVFLNPLLRRENHDDTTFRGETLPMDQAISIQRNRLMQAIAQAVEDNAFDRAAELKKQLNALDSKNTSSDKANDDV